MKREIKFRMWRDGKMQGVHTMFSKESHNDFYTASNESQNFAFSDDEILMQFTGKQGFNNRDLYEGDIVFYEEAEENGDKRYYLVIIWIPEWSMFASIFIDEYHKFLKDGAEALDEGMFWTYTLEKSDYFHYAGNIYQNPELL